MVEPDLIRALNEKHIQGAVLDTVQQEPLATDNPLWHHPAVMLTPHCAAQSWVVPCVAYIGRNIEAIMQGQVVAGLVDRVMGY